MTCAFKIYLFIFHIHWCQVLFDYFQSDIPTSCVEGQLNILDFGYLYLIGNGKKKVIKNSGNLEAELPGLIYYARTTNCI